jgi:hypothetical protein
VTVPGLKLVFKLELPHDLDDNNNDGNVFGKRAGQNFTWSTFNYLLQQQK